MNFGEETLLIKTFPVNKVLNFFCIPLLFFSSGAKYDSGTGWPSFYEAYETSPDHSNVIERPENNADFITFRTEVICRKVGSRTLHSLCNSI